MQLLQRVWLDCLPKDPAGSYCCAIIRARSIATDSQNASVSRSAECRKGCDVIDDIWHDNSPPFTGACQSDLTSGGAMDAVFNASETPLAVCVSGRRKRDYGTSTTSMPRRFICEESSSRSKKRVVIRAPAGRQEWRWFRRDGKWKARARRTYRCGRLSRPYQPVAQGYHGLKVQFKPVCYTGSSQRRIPIDGTRRPHRAAEAGIFVRPCHKPDGSGK